MLPYIWMPHVCMPLLNLDAPLYVWISPYVWMPPCILDDVWMPAVHIQHKESMCCQTKGVSICPHIFGCPICLDAPCMYGCPHMVGHHPYVWMPPVCLDTPHVWIPLYIGHPHIFQCPCMFGHPRVWMPPVCLDNPHMFGCHPVCLDAPICLNAPICVWMITCMFGCCHMFGHPPVCLDAPICLDASLYVWMPPYIWMPPCMFGHPLSLDVPYVWITPCMFGYPTCFGTPCMFKHPYVWMPPVCFDTPICLDALVYAWKMFGCPLYIYNTKSMLCQTKWVSICPHTFGCPPCLYASCMFGHPHVWMSLIPLNAPIYFGASKHTGGSQTYEGHPNIQGSVQTCGTSNHTQRCANMGECKHTGGQPNIWGHPNIQADIQTYGDIQTYRVHPNIWQHLNIKGSSKHMGIQMYRGHMDTSLV